MTYDRSRQRLRRVYKYTHCGKKIGHIGRSYTNIIIARLWFTWKRVSIVAALPALSAIPFLTFGYAVLSGYGMHTTTDSTHLTYLYTTLTILELVFAPRLVSCTRTMKPSLVHLKFPPSGNSLLSPEAINDRSSDSKGLSSMTQYVTLYNRCSRGYVQVNRNRIEAKPDPHRKRGLLRLDTIAFDSYLKIYEPFSQSYLCFDKKGKIITKHSGTGILCVFRELMSPDYFTELQSASNSSWFIGFRNNGSPINGARRMALKDGNRKSRKCDQFIKNKIEIGRTKRKQTQSSQQPRPRVTIRKWSKLSEPDSKAGPFVSYDETLIGWLKSLSKRRRRF